MKVVKWIGGIVGLYVVFVIAFEAGYLGLMQPSFEESGIPMLVLTTTDENGNANDRMLAKMETDGIVYVSAHHWPRGWYHRAVENPDITVQIDGVSYEGTAIVVEGEEFEAISARFPIPFVVKALMGFPPPRDILRLDITTSSD